MKDKLLKIFNHYGKIGQIGQLHEEVYELVEAIKEYDNYKNVTQNMINEQLKYHITEELADVLVVLAQFKEKYDLDIAVSEEYTKPDLKQLCIKVGLFCEYVPEHIYCLRYYRQLQEQLNNIKWFYELDDELISEIMKYKVDRQISRMDKK